MLVVNLLLGIWYCLLSVIYAGIVSFMVICTVLSYLIMALAVIGIVGFFVDKKINDRK